MDEDKILLIYVCVRVFVCVLLGYPILQQPLILPTIAWIHYSDVIIGAIASQIASLTVVYSTVYSEADQRKHQSSASLAFVQGIHRGPVNSLHKWPITRKMVPFDDVIMIALSGIPLLTPLKESIFHETVGYPRKACTQCSFVLIKSQSTWVSNPPMIKSVYQPNVIILFL